MKAGVDWLIFDAYFHSLRRKFDSTATMSGTQGCYVCATCDEWMGELAPPDGDI